MRERGWELVTQTTGQFFDQPTRWNSRLCLHVDKDQAMADDANCGMMLLERRRQGHAQHHSPNRSWEKHAGVLVARENVLQALMGRCHQADIAAARCQIAKVKADRQLLLQDFPWWRLVPCLGVLLYGENVSIVENRVKNCGFLFRSRSESVSVCRQRGQRGPRN